jgi:phenylalanyl-tRNA synthetase alpha chain
MKQQLENLKNEFIENISSINSPEKLEELEKDFLGKKGKLNDILKGIKDLSNEDKKKIGPEANKLKMFISEEVTNKKISIQEAKYALLEEEEKIDVTAEYPSNNKGHKHPISITSNLLEEIFISLGFRIEDGPQVEDETHNFDKLNIPDNHPARDVWDTFWISDDINNEKKAGEKNLLRTHTSPVQIRTMLK